MRSRLIMKNMTLTNRKTTNNSKGFVELGKLTMKPVLNGTCLKREIIVV